MKTRSILRFIASIVIVAFISTQCGIGVSWAYAQDKGASVCRQAGNLRPETVETQAEAGGIGKELGVPEQVSRAQKEANLISSVIQSTVAMGVVAGGSVTALSTGNNRKPALGFFRTMREVVPVRETGIEKRKYTGLFLMFFSMSLALVAFAYFAIVISNQSRFVDPSDFNDFWLHFHVYVGIAAGALFGSGLLFNIDSKFIDFLQMSLRFLVYPFNYFSLVKEYKYSTALTPEEFYLIRQHGKTKVVDNSAEKIVSTDAVDTTHDADAIGTPTKAGAIGDIILRGRLYRLTGVWGLDRVGVFQGASREDANKCVESIKALGKSLNAYQRQAIRHGILPIAKVSKNPEEFKICLAWFENLLMSNPYADAYISKDVVKAALRTGRFEFSVYHPEYSYDEEVTDQSIFGGYWNKVIVPAWTKHISIIVGLPAIPLFMPLLNNITFMQPTIPEKTGVVFTSGAAKEGLDVVLTQVGVPVGELTKEQMVQLSTVTPEAVEQELQKMAEQMKVETVRLCKLSSEDIKTLKTEIVDIDPAQIEAHIAEILKRFGVVFDDTDPVKLDAAKKAYQAAKALAIGA